MFKKRKEVSIVFHLYSVDPQFTIPGTTEYGNDSEFLGNEIGNLSNHLYKQISQILHKEGLSFQKEDSCSGTLLIREAFEDEDGMLQFVINILIDSNPWPQRNKEICKERKRKADNGELGQNWWIHHIDLPNGCILDIDKMTLKDEQTIIESIENELTNWLATINY